MQTQLLSCSAVAGISQAKIERCTAFVHKWSKNQILTGYMSITQLQTNALRRSLRLSYKLCGARYHCQSQTVVIFHMLIYCQIVKTIIQLINAITWINIQGKLASKNLTYHCYIIDCMTIDAKTFELLCG